MLTNRRTGSERYEVESDAATITELWRRRWWGVDKRPGADDFADDDGVPGKSANRTVRLPRMTLAGACWFRLEKDPKGMANPPADPLLVVEV